MPLIIVFLEKSIFDLQITIDRVHPVRINRAHESKGRFGKERE